MGLFDEYERYLVKYQKIYGDKMVLLYQNGMFFETYGVDNEHEKIGLVKEVSEMLNIQLTRRNKAILNNDRSNFLLAGFPLTQLDRYLTILTEENQYVVVVVEQTTPPPNPQRDVTHIVSPGTNLKYLSTSNGNYLVSIYIENEGQRVHQIKSIELQTIGLSAIDVSTGYSVVYEVYNLLDDQKRALDEAYRFTQTFQPKELIIHTRNVKISQEELLRHFDLGQCLVHCRFEQVPNEYYRLSYQNEFLEKIFPKTGMLKPIEFINLERYPIAIISYILLLSFCYQQKETIIDQIESPVTWNNNNYLILDNNCINQLNMTSNSTHKLSSITNLMDQTSTPMGKRLLKERLLLPLVDPKKINERYDLLEFFRQVVTSPDPERLGYLHGHQKIYLFQQYETYLKQIIDIERLHRKMCLGFLQPCEFNQLDLSYQAIHNIMVLLTNHSQTQLIPHSLQNSTLMYITYYNKILDLNETAKYNINNNVSGSFFQKGFNPEIDEFQEQIADYDEYFQQLVTGMSYVINGSNDKPVVTYQYTEDYGYHLEITTNRWNTFESKYSDALIIKTKKHEYTIHKKQLEVIKNRNGKTCKVVSNEIKSVSNKLLKSKELLLHKITEVYRLFLKNTYSQFSLTMKQLVDFIALVDFYKSNAKTSLLYNYCRPKIINETNETANLKAIQLRHPLIERIQETYQYVPQDITYDQSEQGILLFGVNACGKSSLMKAVGIAAILAQAGLYVPAQEFTIKPYHSVMTRIIGNDNLFKGMSSFAVEMSELRGILKRANSHSLVLGDEICHGTETFSGVSLVASAIITLSKLKANFLFATHLHQLSQIHQITELNTVKMYHLRVKFDEQTGNLIYDRRLETGSGHPIYGIEVAKAMDLDHCFIELANTIRKELMDVPDITPIKKSKYNQQLYINQCGIPGCLKTAELTHHINFQCDADSQGFIQHLQKNHRSNLLPLCKTCHAMVHDQQEGHYRYIIRGYIMTSEGLQLDYEKLLNKNSVNLSPKVTSKFSLKMKKK